MENIRKEILKKNLFFNRIDKFYSTKNLNELLEILENVLKNNLYSLQCFQCKRTDINNEYEYITELNKINYSESIVLLIYWINRKSE